MDDGLQRRPVTLTDVAARAGVSQPTASRVLNGSARTPAADIAERVRRAADELGYTPNAQAQALARANTGLLGLVVHDIADPYFSAVVDGVQRAAVSRGRLVLLAVSSRKPDLELRSVESFIAHRTEAIIMVGSRSTTDEAVAAADRLTAVMDRYRRGGGRLVVVGQATPGARAVVPDNRGAAQALAHALVTTAGLSRFVLLAGPERLATAVDRTEGFAAGLAESGLAAQAVLHAPFTRDGGYDSAVEAITAVRPSAAQPVCLVAANDVMAVGAMTAVREAGLSIPGEVQVAGFDDIPTLLDVSPSLTTVRLPLGDMGRWAVELAVDDEQPLVRGASWEIVLRQSTDLTSHHEIRRSGGGTVDGGSSNH
jgi:LacI family transcriptional regulator, galactose operon repressor